MSDLVERLRTYPCWSDLARLHDEAADEIERLRAELATAKRDALEAKQDVRDLLQIKDDNARLRAELAAANERLHEVREIYAGMDGFCADTAPEAYLQRIVRQMYEAAKERKE